MIETEAWVLHQGPEPSDGRPGTLVNEPFSFSGLIDREVLAEPIYGSWEANLTHAIQRQPVDVCRERGEPKVVLGNCGVVRVLQVGPDVTGVHEGDVCRVFGNAVWDKYGYTIKALAYDAPNTMGLLAKRFKLDERMLIPIAKDTKYSLLQWSAFSGRYVTAWANWRVAYNCWRIQTPERECPRPHVWGWGGGTTLAELTLAKHFGCEVAMMSASDARLESIRKLGVTAIDRRQFPNLKYDPDRYAQDAVYRSKYKASEDRFLEIVRDHTNGEGVHIFIDNIGVPVYRATMKALARQGVITSAGWKHGMKLSVLRATECINRHVHVHTHFARLSEAIEAALFAEEHDWMPPVEREVFPWDAVPRLHDAFLCDQIESYFPTFAVNPL